MPLLRHSQLVTAGYPWVVIPVERREEYMAALEKAIVEGDVERFVRFVGSLMGQSFRNNLHNSKKVYLCKIKNKAFVYDEKCH